MEGERPFLPDLRLPEEVEFGAEVAGETVAGVSTSSLVAGGGTIVPGGTVAGVVVGEGRGAVLGVLGADKVLRDLLDGGGISAAVKARAGCGSTLLRGVDGAGGGVLVVLEVVVVVVEVGDSCFVEVGDCLEEVGDSCVLCSGCRGAA